MGPSLDEILAFVEVLAPCCLADNERRRVMTIEFAISRLDTGSVLMLISHPARLTAVEAIDQNRRHHPVLVGHLGNHQRPSKKKGPSWPRITLVARRKSRKQG